MEDKIVKLGVVGLGRGMGIIGDSFDNKNLQIRAICDINPELMRKAKDRLDKEGVDGYLCFESFDEMLKTDIDAVAIATEANRHVPFVLKALEAGKHVLSEIPTVASIDEARQLKAAVKAHPELKYMAGENCCFWAFIQAWKKMYEEGRFGDVLYAEGEYLHSSDIQSLTKNPYTPNHWRSYTPAIHYITHSLGPLLYIMNDRPKTITGFEPDKIYNPYKSAPDNGVALIKTVKGAVIRIFIGFGSYTGFDHNYRLNGTRGSIETDRSKPLSDAHSLANLADIPGTFSNKLDIPVTTAFAGESRMGHGGAEKKMVGAFVDCIINDTEPPLDVDMGIAMSVPGLLAHESAQNGGIPMEMPEI